MPRSFFARFAIQDQERLESLGERLVLGPREHLVRRGEVGGDLFRVEKGHLEVLDRRSRPEVVLDVLGPGDLVGELAFIDGTPRAADVRASGGATVTRWPREALERLLEEDMLLASRFWRVMAQETASRVRAITSEAVTGALRGARSGTGPRDSELEIRIKDLVRGLRDELVAADRALRKDPAGREPAARLAVHLAHVQGELAASAGEHAHISTLLGLGDSTAREIHPFLARSRTADLCITRPDGLAGGATLLAHLVEGSASGDDALGRAVDAWLLASPRATAIRGAHQELTGALHGHVSRARGPLRLAILNPAMGPWLEELQRALVGRGGELLLVEPTRASLRALGAALRDPGAIKVRLIHDSMDPMAAAGGFRHVEGQDLVVVGSLLEYLPAKAASVCLKRLRKCMVPGGQLLLSALGPAPDQALWTGLLGWPMIQREPRVIMAMLELAGFHGGSMVETGGGGVVVKAIASGEAPAAATG